MEHIAHLPSVPNPKCPACWALYADLGFAPAKAEWDFRKSQMTPEQIHAVKLEAGVV